MILLFYCSILNSNNSAVIMTRIMNHCYLLSVCCCIHFYMKELLIRWLEIVVVPKRNQLAYWLACFVARAGPFRKHGSHVEAKQLRKHCILPQFVVNPDAFNTKIRSCRCWCPYHEITPGTASNVKLTLHLEVISMVSLQ